MDEATKDAPADWMEQAPTFGLHSFDRIKVVMPDDREPTRAWIRPLLIGGVIALGLFVAFH